MLWGRRGSKEEKQNKWPIAKMKIGVQAKHESLSLSLSLPLSLTHTHAHTHPTLHYALCAG